MRGYTIRIFVADGDPEGVRIIDEMNWTGTGLVFPRSLWTKIRNRVEFAGAGVFILVGYGESDDELPRVFVGEGDNLRDRLDHHAATKAYWTWGVAFTGVLSKTHVKWLEHTLVRRAKDARQCNLENALIPQAPVLAEHEEADVEGFLDHMLRILPLIKLNVFDRPRPVAISNAPPPQHMGNDRAAPDTVIVPAPQEGFERVYMREHAWHAIRIGGGMLDKIKYCAVFQPSPVSAVTHIAPVKQIEPYGDSGKYRLIFSEPPRPIGPISSGDATDGTMQGPRYTSYAKLSAAKRISDLF
jgi:hypothetical protein